MTTKTGDIVVAVILLCFGLIVGWDSIRLGSGWGLEGPRPGFFPLIMTILVVGGCLISIRQSMTGKSSVKGTKPFVLPGGFQPVLTVFFPAVGMIILTEVIGLYLAAMIYLASYIRVIGGYRWSTVLLISVPIPLIFYVLFDKIFLIPMPMGLYGAQLLRF